MEGSQPSSGADPEFVKVGVGSTGMEYAPSHAQSAETLSVAVFLHEKKA